MKKVLRKLHLYLGLFTIPLGLMYAITGILYTAGIDEKIGIQEDTYIIQEHIRSGDELNFITIWAVKNNIELPSNLHIENDDGDIIIGGAYYSINIEPKDDMTEIIVTTRSILGTILTLHESKAKWYFDILAIFLGISLISFYISGIVIASFTKNIAGKKVIKKEYLIVMLLGFIVTISLGIASI